MKPTWKNHRMMDALLVVVLLSGCILRTCSGDEVAHKHSVDVQNIVTTFDALLVKLKSTIPPVSDHVCVGSVDELNEIENAFVRNEDRSSDAPDISIQFSSNCTKLDRLKTEILKLRNDFKILIAEPTSSYRYRTLKTNLQSKILQFKNFLDSTKEMESGERLNMVVKLQNEFQSQHNRIVETLNELETEQKISNDANVAIAIEHVRQGKVDEAAAAFTLVTDHETQIERTVSSVYGNGDNFDFICRFLVRLPSRSRENGYRSLREHMKKDNNRMEDHRIWILAAELHRIREQDKGIVDDVMVDIKTMVRNDKVDGIVGILNKAGGLEAMRDFAPVLVQTIYEEADNNNGVEKLLTFVKKLTFIRCRLYLINELVLMLKSTERMHGKDMSVIVFELIKLRSVRRPHHKEWQQIIEQNLPNGLRDLMYTNLCIQNAENDEYLYAGVPVNGNQRLVHTANTRTLNDSFYWQVYFTDNGTQILIKNNLYGEHIYLIDEGSYDDEHVLRTWMTGSQDSNRTAEFYLDMLDNGQFLIVNKYFGQVLYSPFDGELNASNNRPVFSKKYDPKNVEIDSKWIIGVCRVDVEYVF